MWRKNLKSDFKKMSVNNVQAHHIYILFYLKNNWLFTKLKKKTLNKTLLEIW